MCLLLFTLFVGYYSNAKLAHTYGFILLDNPVRAVDLWTRTSSTTILKDEKDALLNSIDSTKDQTYDFTGTIRPNWISPALLLTIRIIQCDETELSVLKQKISNKSVNLMVSARNELATYISLRGLIVAKMKAELAEVRLYLDYLHISLICIPLYLTCTYLF